MTYIRLWILSRVSWIGVGMDSASEGVVGERDRDRDHDYVLIRDAVRGICGFDITIIDR